ncbi:glycosyltransferase family 4 protein [Hyphomicrobium sulfonivorans]|uniref:glycosyltransferase family 4 protein n=1 Tax=Hyphomicrobium sulfonivorans TaxID=121290 RepID=UPI00156D6BBF|nr:glycosyltransferase family 4 protein [Hyphomicrobium sulfonivorans]MBI1649860.1 glycosyltransferase family 4 protein [Hyphomicrobium sulfonivorans]NSL71769.1 glycosyltransferase family 4 protein [Hyphomicrobium sulfonivorans]
MQKILFLIGSLGGGGAERATINIAKIWAERGCDVVIATLDAEEPRIYDLPCGIRLVPLGISGRSHGVINALKNNVYRIRRLRNLLITERPDIAFGMMSAAVMLGIVRTRNMIAVGAERAFPPQSIPRGAWQFLRRLVYARLDIVTVQTEVGRDWLLRHTRARNVVVIPNSVEIPLAKQAPELPVSLYVPSGQKLLLGAGRLVHQKAFDRLVVAFGRLAKKHPDWILAITGEGNDRESLERMVVDRGLGERVVLPGRAGNLADWFMAAHAFVLTSRHEGFPNVLVEALAHGCPAVSVDCDTGPRDIIRHEENGLLVSQDDPEALVAALDRIMSDDSLRGKMAANAPEVKTTFSPERISAMWQSLFVGTLGRPEK